MSIMVANGGKCYAVGCFNQGTMVCKNCSERWCLSHFKDFQSRYSPHFSGFQCRICNGKSWKEASEYKIFPNGIIVAVTLSDANVRLMERIQAVES